MASLFENIAWSESFILGWKPHTNHFILFLQVMLTRFHPEFVEFDAKKEAGCYRLARIDFFQPKNIKGFATIAHLPQWYEALCEYSDVYEIEWVEIRKTSAQIEAAGTTLGLTFETAQISFGAFA